MSDNLIQSLTAEMDVPDELRERLFDRASAQRQLDLTYRVIDSPLGSLLVAGTDVGVVRLAYALEGHDRVLATLADRIGSRILMRRQGFDEVARELDEYFAGQRTTFDVPVDLRLAHGFRLAVLGHLRQIAFGRTESYAEVAAAAGSPRAVRAVGSACAHNPVPIIVPCHRVVRSDGGMGGYLGGPAAKEWLLSLEAA